MMSFASATLERVRVPAAVRTTVPGLGAAVTPTDQALSQTSRFWREFYGRRALRHEPSPFAQWCLDGRLGPQDQVLELGCGNGRDSFAFLQQGISVLAIDACQVAIADNARQLRAQRGPVRGEFHAVDFTRLNALCTLAPRALRGVNTVYSRFVLHAIPETLEDAILAFCARTLPAGGRMFHEFRTLRDPLMQQGQVLSANERLTDHYRRFLDPDAFRAKVAALGWRELSFVEGQGLARFGDDDPVVARIVLEKR